MEELVKRRHLLVSPPLILGESRIQRLPAGKTGVNGLRQRLGIAEGVADTLCRHRVLVVAGVADERPAGAVRLSEEVGYIAGAYDALFAFPAAYALFKLRVEGPYLK